MDNEQIIQAVEKAIALGVGKVASPSAVLANSEEEALWAACHVGASGSTLHAVTQTLERQDDLRIFENGWMRWGWGGGGSTSLSAVADWLLANAIVHGARETVTAFAQFVKRNEASLYTVLAVNGLPITERIDLSNNLSLRTLNSLPPSRGRVNLAQLFAGPGSSGRPTIPPGAAALVYEDKGFSPVLVSRDTVSIPQSRRKQEELQKRHELLSDALRRLMPVDPRAPESEQRDQAQQMEAVLSQALGSLSLIDLGMPSQEVHEQLRTREESLSDALRCLTLVGPCSPVAIGTWSQLVGPGVPVTDGGGYAYNHETAFARPVALGPFDIDDARNIFGSYIDLPPKLRQELRIPMDRLNKAMRDTLAADQAIDLGIALEGLLLHDLGKAQGELKYRLSIRGAWLRGGGEQGRLAHFSLLKTIYDLRSAAVHSGHLEDKEKNREILKKGMCLCGTLIRRIIDLGRWPDWTALTLGVGDEK